VPAQSAPVLLPSAVPLATVSQARQETALRRNASSLTNRLVSLSPSVFATNSAPSLSTRLAVGTWCSPSSVRGRGCTVLMRNKSFMQQRPCSVPRAAVWGFQAGSKLVLQTGARSRGVPGRSSSVIRSVRQRQPDTSARFCSCRPFHICSCLGKVWGIGLLFPGLAPRQ